MRVGILAVLLLALPGCGEDGAAGKGAGANGARPKQGPIPVPLSGRDPAHVVGAGSFNRFHLRTAVEGPRPLPPPPAAVPAGPPAWQRRTADARAALVAGKPEAALAVLRGDEPPAGTAVAVLVPYLRGDAGWLAKRILSADQSFRTAALLARELGWPGAEEAALRQAFACQVAAGERVAMLDTLRRILALQELRRDLLATTATRVDLGCVYAMLDNHDRALDYLDQGARDYAQLGRRRARAQTFAAIGLVHLLRAEYAPSLDALDTAQSLLKDTQARKARAYVVGLLGNVYESMGDLDRALALYKSALELHGLEIDVDRGDVLGNLGSVHFHLGLNDEAAAYFEQARDIFEQRGDREGTANAMFSEGRVKKVQGGYRTALAIYARALALQDEGSAEAARTRCAIAETHLAMGNTADALKELEAA